MSLQQSSFHLNKLQSDKASIEANVDEILIVLGTSQANMSKYDDFDWNDDPANTYISIEDERRRLPRKKKPQKEEEKKDQHTKELPPAQDITAPEYIKMVIEMFMNLISINVNKIHIRFEDDFYSCKEGPYSFGLTLNSLNINSTNKEIEFKGPLDMNYEEVLPRDYKNLFLKHILLQDISVYWNSKDRPYVPFRIEHDHREKDQWIFDYEAFEPEEFRVKMLQPFQGMKEATKQGEMSRIITDFPDFHYLIDPFSIDINMSYYRLKDKDVRTHPHPRFQIIALISTINLVVKPYLLNDMRNFMEYMQYQNMIPHLKRYLPRRRPLTRYLHSSNPGIKRVRRQIVKDWFSYIIWANRLKKVLNNNICPEFFEEEIEIHKNKYDKAFARLRNPKDNEFLDRHLLLDRGHDYRHLNNMVAPVIDEYYERKEKDQQRVNMEFFKNFLQKFFVVIKLQSVAIDLYEGSKTLTQRGREMPSLRIVFGRIRFGIKIEGYKIHLQLLLEDLKISDALVMKKRKGAAGMTTINDTFAVKSGFFLDENVSDFFRRHEADDSIFQARDVQDHHLAVVDQKGDTYIADRCDPAIMLNEKPRIHHYQRRGIEAEHADHVNQLRSPDDLIHFSNKSKDLEVEKMEHSRYNFEKFWENKIGKLIGSEEESHKKKIKAEQRSKLQNYNYTYTDDTGRDVTERWWILAEGDPVFMSFNMSYNLFSLPTERKAINLNLDIENFRIEYSNDIIKTLAETMFAYRRITDLGMVVIAPSPEAFQRKIELWTPWYLIKQAFLTPVFDPHGSRVTTTKQEIDEENKEVAASNAAKQIKSSQKAIANLDRNLKDIDIKVKVIIKGLYLSLNTNFDHKRYMKNRNLLQVKTDPFEIIVIKHGNKCGLSVLGVQIMTQSSFELLFQFSLQMQKALSIYFDHPAFKDGKKFYEEIIDKRILESHRKTGLGGSMRMDASTIRHTGAGHHFTISDITRLSQWGTLKGRPTDGTFAGSMFGQKKVHGLTPPRNRPDIDFSRISNIKGPPTKTDRMLENKISPIKGGYIHSAPRAKKERKYEMEEEFDEDESFNDTDEDITNSKKKVKDSAKKGTKKAVIQPEVKKEIELTPVEHDRQVYTDRAELKKHMSDPNPRTRPKAPAPALAQPRTGPSRLNRNQCQYRTNDIPFQEIGYNQDFHEPRKAPAARGQPFEYPDKDGRY